MFDPELEVEIKMPKLPQTEEEREALNAKKVINGVLDMEDLDTEYRRLTVKLSDIRSYGDHDGKHTVGYLTYAVILINMPYSKFQVIYETLTGRVAKKLSDFKFEIEEAPKKRITRKFEEDDE